jgi:hypothetical protein
MTKVRREKTGILSIGVFIIMIAIFLIAYGNGVIRIDEGFSLVIMSYGVWLMALSAIANRGPKGYERSPFSTLAWGLLLTAAGGAWFLNIVTDRWEDSLALVLLILGLLTVAITLRTSRK